MRKKRSSPCSRLRQRRSTSASVRSTQSAASTGIDLGGAVPFTFPKALYAMAALTLLASGLVVLRYSVAHGLDLRPPLTEVLFEDQAAKQAKQPPQFLDPLRRKRLDTAESLMSSMPAL